MNRRVRGNLFPFLKVEGIDLVRFRKIITLARMKELERLKQEVAQLQADGQQKSAVLEQKDALLAEQSATIAKQEAQQLEINRLPQQAFGRRSERYLESS